jgi:hypothetical protein
MATALPRTVEALSQQITLTPELSAAVLRCFATDVLEPSGTVDDPDWSYVSVTSPLIKALRQNAVQLKVDMNYALNVGGYHMVQTIVLDALRLSARQTVSSIKPIASL